MKKEIKIFCVTDWDAQDKMGYEMLDTGEGEKLERFGPYTFVRPYEDAVWSKSGTVKEFWAKADGKFWSSKVGAKAGWKMSKAGFDKKKWEMEYKGIKFLATPTPFRHMGFFPEQATHWDFIEEKIKSVISQNDTFSRVLDPEAQTSSKKYHSVQLKNSKIKFLNLFGYTGVASLFALRAGAEVTHIDASKTSTEWAKENQKINIELVGAPMRIICEDVMKFLEREIKRGNKYDAVIMDPPKFGRGPKGEIWEIAKDLPKLLSQVRKVLSDKPLFVILNSYAIDASSLSLGYALEEAMKGLEGETISGELCLLEKSNNRIIPLSNTAIFC